MVAHVTQRKSNGTKPHFKHSTQNKNQHHERITSIAEYKLVPFREAPAFLQANKYILHGYRVHFSFKMCLYSLIRLHNESGNIYSHGFAILYFLYQFILILKSEFDLEHKIPLSIYCIGCMICFLGSTLFHLFNSHSKETCATLLRCDFAGKNNQNILEKYYIKRNYKELLF